MKISKVDQNGEQFDQNPKNDDRYTEPEKRVDPDTLKALDETFEQYKKAIIELANR